MFMLFLPAACILYFSIIVNTIILCRPHEVTQHATIFDQDKRLNEWIFFFLEKNRK